MSINTNNPCYQFEIVPPEVMLARIKEMLELTCLGTNAAPDTHTSSPRRVVIMHGRQLGKSIANAVMLAKAREDLAAKNWQIIGVDECTSITDEAWAAINRTNVLRCLPEAPAINVVSRDKAQWKREMNLHPAQRRNMRRGQLAQRSYRGRGG